MHGIGLMNGYLIFENITQTSYYFYFVVMLMKYLLGDKIMQFYKLLGDTNISFINNLMLLNIIRYVMNIMCLCILIIKQLSDT